MSYRRHFSKTIAVHYSGSVSYPASQHGGSVSYSGTAYENVNVNIHVETTPFDHSVRNCNDHVGVLTGSVVATEAAQVASIRSNAQKVGQTIVDGFFKTVHSEISQQITELSSRIDATLLHLRELAKRCTDKQHQMEVDYHRISARYLKIFNELNSEMENRIYELDKPVFVFKRESDQASNRAIGGDTAGTVAIAGAEGGTLQAQIEASAVKRRALGTIDKAHEFLWKQKCTDDLLHRCILNEAGAATHYVPVCYLETTDSDHRIDKRVYRTDYLPANGRDDLAEKIDAQAWRSVPEEEFEQLRHHFNREVSSRYATADTHDRRIKDYITTFFDAKTLKSL